MSGVVNKSVAERAMAVKADELIRKPFQPQDLIARVKNLLYPKRAGVITSELQAGDSEEGPRASSQVLTSLFSASAAPMAHAPASPRASVAPAAPVAPRVSAPAPAPGVAAPPAPAHSAEVQKLRNEILRLELLVKRLQAELEAQHQYCAALEAHFKNLQESQ
jgi:CheY-like chemotaxis protein